MSSKVPYHELNNGIEMPIIGLGTFQAQGDEIKKSIHDAIDIRYRLIDTADLYENLEPIGEAIQEAITSKKIKREDLFITTKVWMTDYGKGRVLASVERQLKQMGLNYLDLVLLHWPVVLQDNDKDKFPKDSSGKPIFGSRSLPEIYAELETAQEKGFTRSIGVSNFNSKQIDLIMKSAKIVPVTNQIEAHLCLQQEKLQKFCEKYKILITAYCPLGAAGKKIGQTFNLLTDEKVKSIADKYGKSNAQIALRFLLERGIIVIPKSIHKHRLEENFNVFDFRLSEEDLAVLKQIDMKGNKGRLITFLDYWTEEAPNYPFKEEF